jgi:hypothetical protein
LNAIFEDLKVLLLKAENEPIGRVCDTNWYEDQGRISTEMRKALGSVCVSKGSLPIYRSSAKKKDKWHNKRLEYAEVKSHTCS